MDIDKEFKKMLKPENANLPESVEASEMDEINEMLEIEGLTDEYVEDIIESEFETVDIELVPEDELMENGLYTDIEDDGFFDDIITDRDIGE